MPGTGGTRPNPVFCVMLTQPGPHLGRRRVGQDQQRPGPDGPAWAGGRRDRSAAAGPVVRAGPSHASPVRGAGRVDGSSGHAGHHPSVVASGWGSPVSAASAAATSARLART
jgi:hypothetical protein